MARFHYKAVTPQGSVEEGMMEGPDRAAVVADLQAKGCIPIRAEEALGSGRRLWRGSWRRRSRVAPSAVSALTRELASLTAASVPLDRALQILLDSDTDERVRSLVAGILEAVRGGGSLSSALEARGDVFSRFYISIIKAAEAAGALDEGLARLERHLERSQAIREKLVAALTYPMILLGVTGVSLLIIIVYVVPQFQDLLLGSDRPLPVSTRIVFALADGLRAYGGIALLVCAGAGLYLARWWRDESRRRRVDGMMLRLPLLGRLVTMTETAAFSRSLGGLLQSGLPVVMALGIARDAVANRAMRAGIDKALHSIREGVGLVEPLSASGQFPGLALQMMRVGEETGRLDEMLIRVADSYDRDITVFVGRVLSLLEPLLIVGMGLLVGGIIASLMVAIMSINEIPL